jgi:putative iron-dependent peroxidase
MPGTPQPAIFAMGSRSHFFVELDLLPGASPAAIRTVIAGLEGPRSTTGGTNVVLAFRPEVWTQAGGEVAPGSVDFTPVVGPDGFTMPAEQHDIWVWVSASGYDAVFDTARAITAAFAPIATVATQRHGFTYKDSRDLSGFEDGTENPPLDEAPARCSVPDGLPGAGGSVVIFQRWVHDLPTLHALDVDAQERIIGRTKATSEELADDGKPPSAHIARVVIEEDGEELEIFRRSAPYGDLDEHGLLFVGFSADQRRLALMLDRMVGNGDGVRDAITTWSTPVAGAFYFAPPVAALAAADD